MGQRKWCHRITGYNSINVSSTCSPCVGILWCRWGFCRYNARFLSLTRVCLFPCLFLPSLAKCIYHILAEMGFSSSHNMGWSTILWTSYTVKLDLYLGDFTIFVNFRLIFWAVHLSFLSSTSVSPLKTHLYILYRCFVTCHINFYMHYFFHP